MKKILLIGLFSLSAYAGVFTSISGWTADKIQPDNYYTVDTAGENVRVYEWTPKGAKYIQCISMFTESSKKSPNTQCFRKQK